MREYLLDVEEGDSMSGEELSAAKNEKYEKCCRNLVNRPKNDGFWVRGLDQKFANSWTKTL